MVEVAQPVSRITNAVWATNFTNVEKLNASIRGYNHDDATRKSILSASGLQDDSNAFKDAVNLNNLDDWNEFHSAALK